MFMVLLAVAGNETTRNATTHGVHALLTHPEQLQRCCAATPRRYMGTAVEEILRWASPVLHFRRTATADTELRGKEDPGGRQGRDVARLGQPRRGGVRRPVHASTSPATPTRTSPSAAAGRTSAWAPTWPGSSCG